VSLEVPAQDGRSKKEKKMKKQYQIWTGDESAIDGALYESREGACETLRVWRGWDEIHPVEHCGGRVVCCYASREAADRDPDGAYADTVMMVWG
jgi:hypothetical protein